MTRIRATLIAAAVLSSAVLGPAAVEPTTAAAAVPHRAMVVVDTGGTRYERIVTFTSDSITGLRALELAGATPVIYSFSGQGGAVCRLFGVGRDAGPNCLGGADGDNRYWAYFRAPAGTASYTYSRSGAGSTQVHDGDVEGWRFGTGAAPAYVALPPIATTTTAPPVAPPPPAGGPTGGAPSSPAAGPTGAAATDPAAPPDPAAVAAFVAAANGSTTTTGPAGEPRASAAGPDGKSATQVEAKGAKRANTSAHGSVMDGPDDGGGGGAGSLVIFAVIAAALIGGGLLLRRSRARPVP